MDPIDSNRYILLYNGEGTDEFCVKKTEQSFRDYLGNRSVSLISVDASYFTLENLKKAQAVVFPGGNAAHIAYQVCTENRENIRDFVSKGGSYIGFCAGAYFAGPFNYNFSSTYNYGNLLSCPCEGPAINLGKEANHLNQITARSVLVTNEKKETFYSFWNGGGNYSWFNSGFHLPIVRYEEPISGHAVICSFEKKGAVVVSNIHPEIQLSPTELDTFPNIDKINFLSSSSQNKALFSRMCDLAGLGTGKVKLWQV